MAGLLTKVMRLGALRRAVARRPVSGRRFDGAEAVYRRAQVEITMWLARHHP
jgi:hypothetical protein